MVMERIRELEEAWIINNTENANFISGAKRGSKRM